MSRLYVDRISPYQSASIEIDGLDTSNLTTKTTFNSYTSSNDSKVTSLINATGSYATTDGINTFTAGPQVTSGSDGYVKQQFEAPAQNSEKATITLSGAEIDGTAYNRVFQGVADYSNFYSAGSSLSKQYTDYFGIEYYDGFSYNYGSEFTLNGTHVMLRQRPNGGTNNDASKIQFTDNGDGTSTTDIRGNTIDIGINGTNDSINFGSVINLRSQDPLPSGTEGDLAASGSNLFFHNGTEFKQVAFV